MFLKQGLTTTYSYLHNLDPGQAQINWSLKGWSERLQPEGSRKHLDEGVRKSDSQRTG